MDQEKYLILINGQDRTDSVAHFQLESEYCEIIYTKSSKAYHYRRDKVQVLELQQRFKADGWIVETTDRSLTDLDEILDYGTWYRFVWIGKKAVSYPKADVELRQNCLTDQKVKDLFAYFKETAEAVGLTADNGMNLLSSQYERCERIDSGSVLASYLNPAAKLKKRDLPEVILYPFGLNQSQKVAVENALSSQVSIIQGPPGTGKTQTILNIIVNAVRNGKTVAVVSNNNSATLNVAEKMEAKDLSFLTAFLGSRANKEQFLEAQTGKYPDMESWVLEPEEQQRLEQSVIQLSHELNRQLEAKNRIAAIQQELLELTPEEHDFASYYESIGHAFQGQVKNLSAAEVLFLWLEYEAYTEKGKRLGLLKRILIWLRFNRSAMELFRQAPETAIPYLQREYYRLHRQELTEEKAHLEQMLQDYSFDEKMKELSDWSLQLFRAELSQRFRWNEKRPRFALESFRRASERFNTEYPVILSTTYSVKGTLHPDYLYDYLIVDEASQVDLTTGVLALACAKNVVIVGDLQQLPDVLNSDNIQRSEAVWNRYALPEPYHFSTHSLLASALEVWKDVPTVLLREHYRCHPKIINFCNQKFYGGKLIVMTEDHGEPNVLTIYKTSPGNHARGHLNQRQIDVMREEVLPRLKAQGYNQIGIITPYRDQVAAIQAQLGKEWEVATVHKFQGREKDAIVLTSVDNVITKFVDDPHMLNVAVSRAVRSLTVITSSDPRNDRTNYGDLTRYILYNNCEVVNSTVYSVFDLLYKGYAVQRQAYLKKHRRVSEYDSENLLYTVIEKILRKEQFSSVDCAVHVSVNHLIRDYTLLTEDEAVYARNPLTHVDFLLFRRVDKSPLLAVEVDGTAFHTVGSVQAQRDAKKNQIFERCGIPLLRLRTDESEEANRIEQALAHTLQGNGTSQTQ